MRAVIFGLGRMGLRHLEVLTSMGFDIAAAVDPGDAARAAAAERFNIASDRLHGNAEGAKPALAGADLVVIATTAPSHAELTILSAEAGVKNILCEKPMAVSLDQAKAMIAACTKAGARLAVNHQMRALPHYAWAKARFGSDTAQGDLASLTVTAGNFGLAMNGSHYFELFRYSTGAPVEEVQAWFDETILPNPRGAEFADRSGCVRARAVTGQRLYMDFSADQGLGLRISYSGRTGQLFMDELEGQYDETVRQTEHRGRPTNLYALPWQTERGAVPPTDAMESSRAVVSELIAGGDYPTGEDGLAVMRCLVACYLSHEAGGIPVKVASDETDEASGRVFPWA